MKGVAVTNQALDDYFEALERLKAGRPLHVPKGTKITNDAVSQEAGRGKGSIKRSRDVFGDLILAIDEAAAEQAAGQNKQKAQLDKAKSSAEQCRADLEAALARELSLLDEVYRLRKQLARLTGDKVIPIRGK